MPEVAGFRGIIITMYYADPMRHPVPHFYARYSGYEASFTIDPSAWLAGVMPRQQMHITLGWAELHNEQLMENWQRLISGEIIDKIEGL